MHIAVFFHAFSSYAQRLRIRRLRWTYRFVENNEGLSVENWKSELEARFGLSARTASEYVRLLASKHLIVNCYGRWKTRKAFLSDPYWNSPKLS
jgi:hypothetical protein